MSILTLNHVKLHNICDMLLNFHRSLNRNLRTESIVPKRYIHTHYCAIWSINSKSIQFHSTFNTLWNLENLVYLCVYKKRIKSEFIGELLFYDTMWPVSDVHPSPHQDTAGAHPTETEAEDPLGQVPQYAWESGQTQQEEKVPQYHRYVSIKFFTFRCLMSARF